jgi:hypothetical protein
MRLWRKLLTTKGTKDVHKGNTKDFTATKHEATKDFMVMPLG